MTGIIGTFSGTIFDAGAGIVICGLFIVLGVFASALTIVSLRYRNFDSFGKGLMLIAVSISFFHIFARIRENSTAEDGLTSAVVAAVVVLVLIWGAKLARYIFNTPYTYMVIAMIYFFVLFFGVPG